MSWLTAATQVASAAAGAPAAPAYGSQANRTPINVQPIGVNIGEILRPTMEGSVTNGGTSVPLPSRYAPGADIQMNKAGSPPAKTSMSVSMPGNAIIWVAGGAAALVAFVAARR